MVKKVIQIGSSLGVTLSNDVLKKLGTGKGGEVEIRYNSKRDSVEITVPQTKPQDTNNDFLKQVNYLANRYKTQLKDLENDW